MKKLALAFLSLLCSPAWAQNAVQQAGPVTQNHVTIFVQNGVVMDGGPASGATNTGIGISELLASSLGTGQGPFPDSGTGPYGTNVCDYDGPITSPNGYHYLCFSANAQGGGLLAYGAGGGASPLPLQFIVNGVTYTFPFGGGGASSYTGDLILTGNAVTATPAVETYAWKSPTASIKTLTLYACYSATAWDRVIVVDDKGNAATYQDWIVPAGSDLIVGSDMAFIVSNYGYQILQCDGAGEWMALSMGAP